MFKFIKDIINEREYELKNNSRKVNIAIKRIKNIKDFNDSLISLSEIGLDNGYFIYNKPNFASFGLKNKVDIVWTNWDGKIINIEEFFKTNKISQQYRNAKFIYIFKAGTVNRKKIIMNDVLTHFYDRKKNKNNSII